MPRGTSRFTRGYLSEIHCLFANPFVHDVTSFGWGAGRAIRPSAGDLIDVRKRARFVPVPCQIAHRLGRWH